MPFSLPGLGVQTLWGAGPAPPALTPPPHTRLTVMCSGADNCLAISIPSPLLGDFDPLHGLSLRLQPSRPENPPPLAVPGARGPRFMAPRVTMQTPDCSQLYLCPPQFPAHHWHPLRTSSRGERDTREVSRGAAQHSHRTGSGSAQHRAVEAVGGCGTPPCAGVKPTSGESEGGPAGGPSERAL